MQELPESHGAQLLEGQFFCLQGYSQVLTAYLKPQSHLMHLQDQDRDLSKETILALCLGCPAQPSPLHAGSKVQQLTG